MNLILVYTYSWVGTVLGVWDSASAAAARPPPQLRRVDARDGMDRTLPWPGHVHVRAAGPPLLDAVHVETTGGHISPRARASQGDGGRRRRRPAVHIRAGCHGGRRLVRAPMVTV